MLYAMYTAMSMFKYTTLLNPYYPHKEVILFINFFYQIFLRQVTV